MVHKLHIKLFRYHSATLDVAGRLRVTHWHASNKDHHTTMITKSNEILSFPEGLVTVRAQIRIILQGHQQGWCKGVL